MSDIGHSLFGVCAEVLASVAKSTFSQLKSAPVQIGLPPPTPTTPALADLYYPRAVDIARAAANMFRAADRLPPEESERKWLDAPDPSFKGPY